MTKTELSRRQYAKAFLAGQVVAYCEQVRMGSRLASQIVVPVIYLKTLISMVAREGCRAATERINSERASLWIYRDKRAKRLIDNLQSSPLSELGVWAMGKMFGYADCEVVGFIERTM